MQKECGSNDLTICKIFSQEFGCIKESGPSLHRNDSELPLTQFKDPARFTFSHLRQSRRKLSHPQDIILFFIISLYYILFPKF